MQAIIHHPIFSLNWRYCTMLAGVALAVAGAVAAFFSSAYTLGFAFLLLGAISAFGAHSFRLFVPIKSLEKTAAALQKLQGRFEAEVNRFHRENDRLEKSNQALERQVAELTSLLTQLRDSTHRLRHEVSGLKNSRETLDQSIGRLNREIDAADALYRRSMELFSQRDQTFVQQITELTDLIRELKQEHRIAERIGQLTALKAAFEETHRAFVDERRQLGEVRASLAHETARLSSIRT